MKNLFNFPIITPNSHIILIFQYQSSIKKIKKQEVKRKKSDFLSIKYRQNTPGGIIPLYS